MVVFVIFHGAFHAADDKVSASVVDPDADAEHGDTPS